MKSWLKGGLIGGGIGIFLSLFYVSGWADLLPGNLGGILNPVLFLYTSLSTFYPVGLTYILIIINIIFWFIIGAIVGFIIGKIKKGGNKNG